ncbi:hypothetical protein CEP54_006225 [Fusarium duplospermum]|uniref:Xylanolytic transcriptional activator regulatory domain-containing protein n=1 Tax=Fusarium duplospermum TaxID=1325734 RepID=A0A428Q869_9HYPO|nr:hypothetical protein CEP54_006225 [Fusarium duplospermum]
MAAQSSQAPLAGVPVPHALNDAGTQETSSDEHAETSIGKLSLEDGNAIYTGSSHWATILDDIRQLKDELSDDFSDSATSPESTLLTADMGLPTTRMSLLTSVPCLPREQIPAMMPPRKVVDRHVSHFFNTFDFAPVILHRNTFLAEYTNFWDNLSAAPIMWIGLLFSIMGISVFLQQQDIGASGLSTTESQDTLETYRTLTIHCLVAGDYLRSSRYTIETLTLHFALDHNVNVDTYVGNWVLMGVVIRVAMRMGLHRDPAHWSTIRPLQAELRRRIWMTLYDMDFFTSTQIGLPRIIKDSQCDTHPPAHLFDGDINLDHDETPAERPLTEPSSLLYIIQRHRIIKLAAEIYDATEAGPPLSATISALSTKLEETVDSIPAWLKHKPLEASITDNPVTILYRMVLDILINKAVYLLHRRVFVKGSSGEVNTKSSKAMSEEIQPGGLMYGIHWKVATSLNHEFLQATMMLCFALSRFDEQGSTTENALSRRDDILDALKNARSLWEMTASQSTEAQRAVKTISVVLRLEESPTTASLDDLFKQMPGVIAPGYFDPFEDMILDPSLLGAFGSISGGFTL